MPIFYIVFLLSLVQGISEFLPISSAGHLLLIERFLHFNNGGLTFDLALNLGTLLTIMVYFYKYILVMLKEGTNIILLKNKNYSNLLLIKLIIATIPVTIVGFLLVHFQLENSFRTPLVLGICLIVFGIILYAVDKKSKNTITLSEISYKNAFIVGLLQCLALVPGVSRSGITITGARAQSINKHDSVIFSFLIAIPSTLGAVILIALHLHKAHLPIDYLTLLLGIILSFIFGMIFINLLLKFLAKYSFKVFMIYRIILGIIVIILSSKLII